MPDKTRPIRIMIVDDHPVVRMGLSAIIDTQPGMTVVAEAGDGKQAVESFRTHKPDITLMDLRLPGTGGVEAITLIRKEFPAARFIVLTTYDGDEDIHRALRAGAQAYLLKGMTHDELLDAVNAVHKGLRRIPSEIAERLAERMPGPPLTAGELAVLRLMVRGKTNKEIAAAQSITEGTVKWYVNVIFGKLGVSDRAGAIHAALQRGIVHLDDAEQTRGADRPPHDRH